MKNVFKTTLIAVFILIAFRIQGAAQSQYDTLKVLFVGNSYIYVGNLPHLVSIISDSCKTKLITRKSVIGGASLSEHWNGMKGLKTKELICNGNFDIVVLQDQSLAAVNQPDSLRKYVRLFCDYIRDNNARPFLYLTWAREKSPEQQEIISKVYREAAAENNATVVPVGEAWALARNMNPNYQLYFRDGSHPSTDGAILTACVFVAVILNEIPDLLPNYYIITDSVGESVWLAGSDNDFLNLCKEVARKFIR
ncbi:MAG: hypothetical protein WCD55_13945 [Bacteroidales bacterium]